MKVGPGGDAKTPAEAVCLLRARRLSGEVAGGREVAIELAPGDYVLDAPLVLTAADSGSRKAPVVWRGSTNGVSRIVGSAPIPKSRFSPVSASDPNAARFPASSLAHMFVMDAADLLPAALPEWPEAKSFRAPPLPLLFLGGRFQEIARWPNRESEDLHGWSGFGCSSTGDVNRVFSTLDKSRPARWNAERGVWVHGYFGNTWHDEYMFATVFDGATNELEFAAKPTYPLSPGENEKLKFVALNIPEELDAPGEWWLDRGSRRVYYWPPDEFATEESVLVSFAGPLVTFSPRTHDVRFEGVEFAYAESAFSMPGDGVERVEFDRCSFHSFAESSVVRGSGNLVRRSTFAHCAKGCVQVMGGNRLALAPALNVVEDCTFTDFERLQLTMAPAVQLKDGCGNAVRGCRFSKSAHVAVLYSGNEHLIGWSEFSELERETQDCGAVYSGRNTTTHGTVIVRCDFRDIDTGDVTGIYFDDCDWGDDAYCCTFTNVARPFLVGGGELHRIEWNAIKNATRQGIHVDRRGVIWADRPTSYLWGKPNWWRDFFTNAGIDPSAHPWRAAYPKIESALGGSPNEPWNNVIQGNLMQDCTGKWTDIDPNATESSYYASTNRITIVNNVTASTTGNPGVGIVGFTHLGRAATFADVPGMEDAYKRTSALETAPSPEVTSPDGAVVVRIGLNSAARLSCSAEYRGETVLDPSPMGVTVDDVDYGRMMSPCSNAAVRVVAGEAAVPGASPDGYSEMIVPLEDVVHGGTNAQAEVRVFANGLAWRMRVFGEGGRTVAGEVAQWDVPNGDMSCSGIPSDGWTCDGEVVTTWHTAVLSSPAVANGILYVDVPDGGERSLSALERRLLAENEVSAAVKTGSGVLQLDERLEDYAGTWDISNGTVMVMVPCNAFGSSCDAFVTVSTSAAIRVVASSVMQRPVRFVAQNSKLLLIENGVDAAFEKQVVVTGSQFRFSVGDGGSAVFRGGFDSGKTSAITSGGGAIVFANVPASISTLYVQTNNKIYFDCPSNCVKAITAAFSTNYQDGVIALRCDDALSGYERISMSDIKAGAIDVAGHAMTTGSFAKFSGGEITSSAPGGRLRVIQVKNVTNANCRITGDLAFSKAGTGEFRFARLVESTGALEVEEGVLRMTAAATWPRVKQVAVGGEGVLIVEGVEQFGPSPVVWILGGGSIRLESGSRLVCRSLKVNGVGVAAGVYHDGAELPGGIVFSGDGELEVLRPSFAVVLR